MFCFALGMLAISLRNVIPDYFSIIIGNAVIMVGVCVLTLAVCEFAEHEFPLKTLGAILINYIIFFHIFPEENYFRLRVIVYCFTSVLINLLTVRYLFKLEGTRRTKARYFLIVLFAISIFISFVRGIYFTFFEASTNLLDTNLFNQIYFLVATAIPIFLTFAFILLVSQSAPDGLKEKS